MGAFWHESASMPGCTLSPEKMSRFPSVCGKAHGEAVWGKVGDHGLIQALFDCKSDHSEGDGIQCIACVPDIVETNLAGNPTVFLRLPADTVCEAFGQEIAENDMESRCIRQLKP